ncbi:ketopantoate reductase family protein [Marinobacterium lutimaris]|uniref:2-dehydropantoate 2-reductase n=1 Tax=Marinobacterium lutimaris TaxID=568106 RepID=A0A1H5YG79_9GAMM|nr:2-dehydropantoate 2-reductase [Marinobacterium lutimaris]SEG22722.1 ketopantoate reductase [Marinobacterium lutimaris]
MKFLILGAGGIGCYYGARLLGAGHQCTFVARGAHLAAMQQNGLEVRHSDYHFNAAVDAIAMETLTAERHADDYDLVLFCLKGGATAETLEQLGAWLSDSSLVLLSLQNGVDNEPLIAEKIGDARTLGGLAVRIGGHILEPGVIEATGPAQIVMGAWPDSAAQPSTDTFAEKLSLLFNEAGIPTQVSPDIRYELWRKLLINNSMNPLSALTGRDTRSLTSDPVLRPIIHALMTETATVGIADGVALGEKDVEEMFELICGFDAIKTSMLVDREKGRPLELEGISGAVLSRAAKRGINTPLTALIHRLLELNIGSAELLTSLKSH